MSTLWPLLETSEMSMCTVDHPVTLVLVCKLLVLGCRGEIVGAAGRTVERHELRPDFASGPPGLNYSQKTNLTSGDLWVWVLTSDDLWVWADFV